MFIRSHIKPRAYDWMFLASTITERSLTDILKDAANVGAIARRAEHYGLRAAILKGAVLDPTDPIANDMPKEGLEAVKFNMVGRTFAAN